MRAKEEEWELVRERMHREIKILRRQNTESLSLKIDAGEGPGRQHGSHLEGAAKNVNINKGDLRENVRDTRSQRLAASNV